MDFKKPVASESRPWLKIVPDTTWNLERIRERFEVPYDTPPPLIEAIGKAVALKAIDRYEKLRHWKFRGDFPVTLDKSDLQTDLDLTASPLLKLSDMQAVDSGILYQRRGMKAYVMEMTFETQEVMVIHEQVGRPDGFLNETEELYPKGIEKEL